MKGKAFSILLSVVFWIVILSPTAPFLLSEWQQWKAAGQWTAYLQKANDFNDPYLKALIKRAAPVKKQMPVKINVTSSISVYVKNLVDIYPVHQADIVIQDREKTCAIPNFYSCLFAYSFFHPPLLSA